MNVFRFLGVNLLLFLLGAVTGILHPLLLAYTGRSTNPADNAYAFLPILLAPLYAAIMTVTFTVLRVSLLLAGVAAAPVWSYSGVLALIAAVVGHVIVHAVV